MKSEEWIRDELDILESISEFDRSIYDDIKIEVLKEILEEDYILKFNVMEA